MTAGGWAEQALQPKRDQARPCEGSDSRAPGRGAGAQQIPGVALLGGLNEQPQPSVKTPERRHLSGATLESPLDCKEIQPVHPKGYQS